MGDWVVALMLGTITTTVVSEVFDELMQGDSLKKKGGSGVVVKGTEV